MILRLAAAVLLAVVGTGLTATTASAAPAPPVCVQYNDPIHMGSYPVCLL
jgi:hypothetical protein